MSKTHTIICLSEAAGPITHCSGTSGNEAIIARAPVMTGRGKVWVPFLSGNALRHRVVRDPGIDYLLDLYGLRGTLTLPVLNFLRHGGNLSESTATENTARIAEMKRTWPLLRLLGGSLPNQILAGSLHVWRGELVCEENRDYLRGLFGDTIPTRRLKSAEEFIGNYQYTRGDAAKSGEAAGDENSDSNLMIFSGQQVNRGALFVHGFVLSHVSMVELGALLLSLRLWQSNGGTIGGQSARGHGRLATSLVTDTLDQVAAVAEYTAYAKSMRDDAVKWLFDCFKRQEKPAKPKKAKVHRESTDNRSSIVPARW